MLTNGGHGRASSVTATPVLSQSQVHRELGHPCSPCVGLGARTSCEVLAPAQMRRAHGRAVEDRAVVKMGKATVVAKPDASPQSVLELSSYNSDDNV